MRALSLAAAIALYGAQACNGPAHAADTKWWILNPHTTLCHPVAGSRAPQSPVAAEHALRYFHIYGGTEVYRDDTGKVSYVFVKDSSNGLGFSYYTDKETCERMRAEGLANGTLTDPEELK